MSFGSLVFTPVVKRLQERYGSRRQYGRMEASRTGNNDLTDFEIDFLADRDSFYWATLGSTGWPYVQHRGGPRGFLRVVDNRTLAFGDFQGNKQFISTGNLLTDNRVAMIFVDYPQQARLKILGRVDVLDGEKMAPWLQRVKMPDNRAIIERVFLIHLEAYDWNCPQHITPRYTAEEIREAVRDVEEKSCVQCRQKMKNCVKRSRICVRDNTEQLAEQPRRSKSLCIHALGVTFSARNGNPESSPG